MSGPLYELALSVPWCITDDALEAMLRIAANDPLPEEDAKARFHGPKSLALRNGKRRDDSGRMTMQDSVAVIPIDGPIYRYADFFTSVSGGITTESLARDFQAAIADPAVSAVLFTIDSPGGEATGINELSDAIYQARGTKPIVAYVEGFGASAAYWIASAADLLLIDASAAVGSIGTVFGVADPSKRISRTIDFVSSQSPKKRADPTTEAGRAYYQTMVDDMTEVFIASVMRNRGITRDQVLAAQGGMLIGEKAIAAGLADGLGSEEGATHALILGALPQLPKKHTPQIGGRSARKETKPMAKGFWAWMAGENDDPPTTTPPALASEQKAAAPAAPLAPAQSKSEDDARQAQITAENAELRRQLARVQAERITSDAQAFATGQITAGHALPVEREAMVRLYAQAAQDDIDHPITSADVPPSRVALLTAAYTTRPANRLASNLLPSVLPPGAAVLPNAAGEASVLDEAEQSARSYAKRVNGKG